MAPIVPLTNKQIQNMKKEFLMLDTDGDGTISVSELGTILRSMRGKLRASEAEIKKALKEIDRFHYSRNVSLIQHFRLKHSNQFQS